MLKYQPRISVDVVVRDYEKYEVYKAKTFCIKP